MVIAKRLFYHFHNNTLGVRVLWEKQCLLRLQVKPSVKLFHNFQFNRFHYRTILGEQSYDYHSWHIQEHKSYGSRVLVREVLRWYYLNGMKMTAIVRQYCEANVLNKEKKKGVICNEHIRKWPELPVKIQVIPVGCSANGVAGIRWRAVSFYI